ncbi:MAG TPA: glutamate--tRNA ligase [Candidatus Omnitrophota bacterium]|nr:glutamate--tRNA ligase [Candidatus Omnitrophota bacterium]HPN89166.1 glutamate--tRNA ligase [Candidatus Omnitrophota bacterium]
MVKVRFAPSPTGYLHIGGARTALFNWMYAKSQNGTFVLRIEDTDLERSKQEYVDEILDSVAWLGMSWDELYFQSKRFDIYRAHAEKLLKAGLAYKDNGAIFLKVKKQEIKIYDLIRGEINFDTSYFTAHNDDGAPVLDKEGQVVLKDEVLIKADGSPTYNFCCVVDDALMEMTCIIRGEDHISNTPKQILMYEALGYKPPKFAHLPLIMGKDGGRLSKRTGAVAVSEYRKMGFLPQAIDNYLMLLGWAPGNNQEIMNLNSAIKIFSIKKINKAAAVFDMDKLKWINTQYLKQMNVVDVASFLKPFLKERGFIDESTDEMWLQKIIGLYKGRFSTLDEFLERTDFIFQENIIIDSSLVLKHLTNDKKEIFFQLAQAYETLESFDSKSLEAVFRGLVEKCGLKASDVVHPVRVSLTGKDVGPGLFETMEILGRVKTVNRLRQAFR